MTSTFQFQLLDVSDLPHIASLLLGETPVVPVVERFLSREGASLLVDRARERFATEPSAPALRIACELAVVVSSASYPHRVSDAFGLTHQSIKCPAELQDAVLVRPESTRRAISEGFARLFAARPGLDAEIPTAIRADSATGALATHFVGELADQLRRLADRATTAWRDAVLAPLAVARAAERHRLSIWEAVGLPLYDAAPETLWWPGATFGPERPTLTPDEWRALDLAAFSAGDVRDLSEQICAIEAADGETVTAAAAALEQLAPERAREISNRAFDHLAAMVHGAYRAALWRVLPRLREDIAPRVALTVEQARAGLEIDDERAVDHVFNAVPLAILTEPGVIAAAAAAYRRHGALERFFEVYAHAGDAPLRAFGHATLAPGLDARYDAERYLRDATYLSEQEALPTELGAAMLETITSSAERSPAAWRAEHVRVGDVLLDLADEYPDAVAECVQALVEHEDAAIADVAAEVTVAL